MTPGWADGDTTLATPLPRGLLLLGGGKKRCSRSPSLSGEARSRHRPPCSHAGPLASRGRGGLGGPLTALAPDPDGGVGPLPGRWPHLPKMALSGLQGSRGEAAAGAVVSTWDQIYGYQVNSPKKASEGTTQPGRLHTVWGRVTLSIGSCKIRVDSQATSPAESSFQCGSPGSPGSSLQSGPAVTHGPEPPTPPCRAPSEEGGVAVGRGRGRH